MHSVAQRLRGLPRPDRARCAPSALPRCLGPLPTHTCSAVRRPPHVQGRLLARTLPGQVAAGLDASCDKRGGRNRDQLHHQALPVAAVSHSRAFWVQRQRGEGQPARTLVRRGLQPGLSTSPRGLHRGCRLHCRLVTTADCVTPGPKWPLHTLWATPTPRRVSCHHHAARGTGRL